MKKLLTILSIFLLSFALVACSSNKDDEQVKADKEAAKEAKREAKEKKEEEEKNLPICPQTAILRELEIMKDYGREQPDPTQLVAQAKMMSIDGDCEYQNDDKRGGIDVKFDLNMVAQRGPRLGGLRTTFPYFVAVVDPDNNILNKESLTAKFGFSSNDNIGMDAEMIHVFIPLDKAKRETGPFYRVLVGFQIEKEPPPEKTAPSSSPND